jgi:hypothetical protein
MKTSTKTAHKINNWKEKKQSKKNKFALDAAKRLDPSRGFVIFTSLKDIK